MSAYKQIEPSCEEQQIAREAVIRQVKLSEADKAIVCDTAPETYLDDDGNLRFEWNRLTNRSTPMGMNGLVAYAVFSRDGEHSPLRLERVVVCPEQDEYTFMELGVK